MLLFIQCVYLHIYPASILWWGQYKRDMSLRYGSCGFVLWFHVSPIWISLKPISHLHWPNHEMLAGQYASSKLVHFGVGTVAYLLCLVHYWIPVRYWTQSLPLLSRDFHEHFFFLLFRLAEIVKASNTAQNTLALLMKAVTEVIISVYLQSLCSVTLFTV